MRVVQMLPELNEGGVERGVVEFNRELIKLGYDSWTISAGGRLAHTIAQDGGQHISFDLASKNLLTAPTRVWGLRKILRDLNPDIIHVRSRVPAWLAYLANRPLGIPFVTTVHGFNSVNPYSRIMTCGDKVICVSGAIKDYVIKHYGVDEQKLVVIPRGVDLDKFDPNNIDDSFIASFRGTYNLADKFVVSSVGRITQLKDLETFISAIAELKSSVPNLVGLIVGGVHTDRREYFNRLKLLVKQLGVDDFVHFAGSQEKVPEIYAMSDVVVSSSKKPESFGRSAAEAMAMNVPVVATGHGGILDIVLPGKTGQLFSPGDVAGLVQAILACSEMPRTGLREFVRENFTLDRMVSMTCDVYRQTVPR